MVDGVWLWDIEFDGFKFFSLQAKFLNGSLSEKKSGCGLAIHRTGKRQPNMLSG
jgi:hypothetical protein